MTVPANISEPPMVHPEQKSLHRFKGKEHPIPMELFQHVFNTVLGIWEHEQLEPIYNWVYYRGFLNFNDIHQQYHHNPEDIKREEEYKANGVKDCLNSNIIQKITLFNY